MGVLEAKSEHLGSPCIVECLEWPPPLPGLAQSKDPGGHRSWPAWEGGLAHAEGLSGLMCPCAFSPVPHISGICPLRCLRRPFQSCRSQEGPIAHRWNRKKSDHCKDCLLPNRVMESRLVLSEVLGGLFLPTQILSLFLLFLWATWRSLKP